MKKYILFLIFFFLIFPSFCFSKILDIPFIPQVLPGDWNNTLNCGQTSYYMADKFLSEDANLNFEDIKKIDDFLNIKFSDPIRNYNGYYTNTTKLKSIAEDFGGYEDVFISRTSNDFESIKNEINNGSLVIPLVRISMKLDKDGHFMLMIGFDEEYVYFNDPGKVFGKEKKYLIKDFLDVWKSENYNYLILKKKNKNIETNSKTDNIQSVVQDSIKNEIFSDNIDIVDSEDVFNNLPKNVVNNTIGVSANSIVQSNQSSNLISIIETNDLNNKNDINNEYFVGYGYGYGNVFEDISQNIIEDKGGASAPVYLPEFDFKINYKENKLVIPLEFDFYNVSTDISKYYFKMDYKINKDGEWKSLFDNYNLNYYKYYVKTNNDTYYFRLRLCDINNYCSDYKEVSQKVSLDSASDMNLIGYDGNDVVMDRKEYFNVCFDINPEQNILITKGVKITLSPYCNISIKGHLFAMGEPDERIYITSISDDVLNSWISIVFENSFGSILNNVDILNGGYYAPKGKKYPKIIVDNSIVTLDGVKFYKDAGQSVYVHNNSAFYMLNSSIKYTSNSFNNVFIKDSIGVLDNNIIEGGGAGVRLINLDERFSVINNKITNNYFYPIHAENSFAIVKDNLFLKNRYNVLFLDLNLQEPGEYFLRKGVYSLKNVNIGAGVKLNIESGSILKMEQGYGNFNIYGSISAIGEKNNPIVFVSINDNEYENVESNFGFKHDFWAGIHIRSSEKSIFDNCIFKFGARRDNDLNGVINIEDSNNIIIQNSTFKENYYAIKIKNSKNININNCNFSNNFYGINSLNSNILLNNNIYNSNIINEIIK